MSNSEPPVTKPHVSGSWRVIRSRAIPANVTAINANESLLTQPSEARQSGKADVEVLMNRSKSAAYVESLKHPLPEA